jgi:hypothetical protein
MSASNMVHRTIQSFCDLLTEAGMIKICYNGADFKRYSCRYEL